MGYYDPPEPKWQGTLEVTCGKPTCTTTVTAEFTRAIRALKEAVAVNSKNDAEQTYAAAKNVLAKWGDSVDTDDAECPFEGEVEAWINPGTGNTVEWDCPVCEYHHEQENE